MHPRDGRNRSLRRRRSATTAMLRAPRSMAMPCRQDTARPASPGPAGRQVRKRQITAGTDNELRRMPIDRPAWNEIYQRFGKFIADFPELPKPSVPMKRPMSQMDRLRAPNRQSGRRRLCGMPGLRPLGIPDRFPLGAVERAHFHTMQTNGEAGDFILYQHDFVG